MREWLSRQPEARVLHVFERACNLVDDEGEVVSLVAAELGPGPFAAVLAGGTSFDAITPESPVLVTDTEIQVGALVVETGMAQLWQPRPDWQRLRRCLVDLSTYLPHLRRALAPHAATDTALAAAFQTRLTSAGTALIRALSTGDLAACRRNAGQLAGMGAGSTPAGDDFLVGAIYALWATRPEAEARAIAGAMVESAAPLTTTFSGAWLRAAARGEAIQPWHDLVDAMALSDGFAVNHAIRCIMSLGHTSGADALAGFAAALTG